MIDTGEEFNSNRVETGTGGLSQLVLPEVVIRQGEYGRALERIWREEFYKARTDGFYAADENRDSPRFSFLFAFHGHAGLYTKASVWPQEMMPAMFGRSKIPRETFVHNPPLVADIKNITNLGLISSDIHVNGISVVEGIEDETPGTVDFYVPDDHDLDLRSFLDHLTKRQGTFRDYVVSVDNDSPASSTLTFAVDTARVGLNGLMQYAMRDTDRPDEMFGNKFGMEDRINFPMKGSGSHLAVPVGIPANYIEYVLVNEKSDAWNGRIDVLLEACRVDGHEIPVISLHDLSVIKGK